MRKFKYLGAHVRYHNICVNVLVHSVAWLLGGLHGTFTKLPVIVSFRRMGPTSETIRPVRRKGTSNVIEVMFVSGLRLILDFCRQTHHNT